MEKSILSINEQEDVDIITFQGQIIKVKKVLNIGDITKLITVYMEEYKTGTQDTSILLAELAFKSTLFDLVTDKDWKDEDFNAIWSTSLFDDVASRVSNLEFAKQILSKTIQRYDARNSVNESFKQVTEFVQDKIEEVSGRIIAFVDRLNSSGVDGSTVAEIAELAKQVKDLNLTTDIPFQK